VAQDHNDIYSIVERLAILEGRITPANVKHGLNTQQKSVPQMPALFKPKTQKILGGNPNAKNPMSGYAVGGCEEEVESDKEMAEDASMTWDGVSPDTKEFTSEDVLEKVKKSFTDFVKEIEKIQDSDLKDKKNDDNDLRAKDKTDRDLSPKQVAEHDTNLPEAAPVKTITNECGQWEIYEDGKSGFEIRHGNRRLPTRFRNLEEAEMALEMFNIRRRRRDEAADYIDEA